MPGLFDLVSRTETDICISVETGSLLTDPDDPLTRIATRVRPGLIKVEVYDKSYVSGSLERANYVLSVQFVLSKRVVM